MKTFIIPRQNLPLNKTLLIVLFFVVGLRSSFAAAPCKKDSVLLIHKQGRDKLYYKTCFGANVLLVYSTHTNTVKILADGDEDMRPLAQTINDIKCTEKTNLIWLIEQAYLKSRKNYF